MSFKWPWFGSQAHPRLAKMPRVTHQCWWGCPGLTCQGSVVWILDLAVGVALSTSQVGQQLLHLVAGHQLPDTEQRMFEHLLCSHVVHVSRRISVPFETVLAEKGGDQIEISGKRFATFCVSHLSNVTIDLGQFHFWSTKEDAVVWLVSIWLLSRLVTLTVCSELNDVRENRIVQ